MKFIVHLEYCVQVWSPVPRYGNWERILDIEKVQRKFTRLIDNIGTLPYGARLKILNFTTLAERRIRGDLIETFKIVRNFVNYGQSMFKMSRSGLNIISRGTKVSLARKDFLSERVINYWNLLPANVKRSPSINSFKANLDIYKAKCLADKYYCKVGNFWEVSRVSHRLRRMGGSTIFRSIISSVS